MQKHSRIIISLFLFFTLFNLHAESKKTSRIPQFSNEEVNVWKTIIYPSKTQILKMHRHEYNRVLMAFTDGTLKIVDNNGKVHYLELKKNQPYYLTKDIPGELHTDENIGTYPIEALVIELKK